MIKIRAGQCWLDYTCMDYHYETQPNPNPLSWFLHNNPHWFHELEVGFNHFVELIVPWFLLFYLFLPLFTNYPRLLHFCNKIVVLGCLKGKADSNFSQH